jgi:CO/xanthine dehydrogenase Mo-binding subunit
VKQLGIVGQSVKRVDSIGHVTGQTQFVDDVSYPGMLHLKMVRSPCSRGIIHRIDTSRAEAVPGVATVVTATDVPNNWYTILTLIGVGPPDEPVLAHEEVMYEGEPMCAVVAETDEIAMEAATLVELDIEEQEPVLDLEFAVSPEAPAIKKWGNNTFMYDGMNHRRLRFGDAEAALQTADRVVEGTYTLSPIEHAPIETHCCVVKPEAGPSSGAGRLVVHTNTQALYFSMDNTSIILGIPGSRLRFIGGTVGGGFGGKVDVMLEPITCIAAMKTGRPVKWRWSRREEFKYSSTRAAVKLQYWDGVQRDGRIIARKVRSLQEAGAYHKHSPYGAQKHMANVPGPYNIPNVHVDVYCVYTNRQPSSSMRGFGVTEASFAIELQMERISRELGMDPWELRMINAYRDGDMRPVRKVAEDCTLIETLQAAAKLTGHELPASLQALSSSAR